MNVKINDLESELKTKRRNIRELQYAIKELKKQIRVKAQEVRKLEAYKVFREEEERDEREALNEM